MAEESAPAPRPTVFDQGLADRICEALADGKSLRSICTPENMPSKATVFRWLGDNKAFSDQYERARDAQADSHADDIVDIADRKDLDPNDKRVMIDARKWTAGKQRPKKYGDKVDLNHSGAIGITITPDDAEL